MNIFRLTAGNNDSDPLPPSSPSLAPDDSRINVAGVPHAESSEERAVGGEEWKEREEGREVSDVREGDEADADVKEQREDHGMPCLNVTIEEVTLFQTLRAKSPEASPLSNISTSSTSKASNTSQASDASSAFTSATETTPTPSSLHLLRTQNSLSTLSPSFSRTNSHRASTPASPASHPEASDRVYFWRPPEFRWRPDFESSHCLLCHIAFSVFVRRHHCRRCGRLVCNECSKNRGYNAASMHERSQRPKRVCKDCFRVMPDRLSQKMTADTVDKHLLVWDGRGSKCLRKLPSTPSHTHNHTANNSPCHTNNHSCDLSYAYPSQRLSRDSSRHGRNKERVCRAEGEDHLGEEWVECDDGVG